MMIFPRTLTHTTVILIYIRVKSSPSPARGNIIIMPEIPKIFLVYWWIIYWF